MKLCAIQPPYANSVCDAEKSVGFLIDELNKCSSECDVILTPEYSNMLAAFPLDEGRAFVRKHTPALLDAAVSAARRCDAIVAVNFLCEVSDGVFRNTTRIFDRNGLEAGNFYKQHLPSSEKRGVKPDFEYTRSFSSPEIVEIDGIRFGFLICYDTYFSEYIAHLAYCKPDLILVSSFQRGERQDVLRMLNQNLAFSCNSFVLRSSVSMGENAQVGGMSLIAAPEGVILAEMGSATGAVQLEIGDVKRKYMRSNAFGGAQIRNDSFIENGRTPWSYRPCGSMMSQADNDLDYPRVCAHRGWSSAMPENTMPSFAAAIALGADEIEMDVRFTRDGVPVINHDPVLERVSNGTGILEDHTFAELKQLDFGIHKGEQFAGVRIASLEEVLRKFACHAVFNIHLKGVGGDEFGRYPAELMRQIVALLKKYDHDRHTYFMGSYGVMETALQVAPEINRCMGAYPDPWKIVDRAIEYKCQKLQFFLPYMDQKMICKAKEHNIICNLFYCDNYPSAICFYNMGIDTILTNNCSVVIGSRNEYLKFRG